MEKDFLKVSKERNQAEESRKNAQVHLVQTMDRLKLAERRGEQLSEELERTKGALRSAEEKIKIRKQLKEEGVKLRQQKPSAMVCLKFLIYYLAWIPEKILEGMMYYLQNGAKQTLKRIYQKLYRRKQ